MTCLQQAAGMRGGGGGDWEGEGTGRGGGVHVQTDRSTENPELSYTKKMKKKSM